MLFGAMEPGDWFTYMPLKYPQWTREYGKTYAVMEGGRPVVVTSDVNLLNDVFVKNFASFPTHKVEQRCCIPLLECLFLL